VLCDGPEQAMAVANLIAPEHLELQVADPEALLPLVRHAGAVFTGGFAPASVGDYLAGPSHVCPQRLGTLSRARCGSTTSSSTCTSSPSTGPRWPAWGSTSPPSRRAEGLDSHARSVQLRGS
jgi:histidinol dehydrogenase